MNINKNSSKQQDNYDKVIGYNTKTNEVFVCNYLFRYPDLKGATGAILQPVTAEQVEEYNTKEYVEEYLSGAGVLKELDDVIDDLTEKFADMTDLGDGEYDEALEKYIEDNAQKRVDSINDDLIWGWINNCDGLYVGHECYDADSADEINDELEKVFGYEIETYDCIGGGRIFGGDCSPFDSPDFVSLDDELVAKIKEIDPIKK